MQSQIYLPLLYKTSVMKKILSLIIMVSVMISCQDQQDDGIIIQEPEYQILRISDNGAIQCVYSYPSVDENGNEIMLSAALVAWKPAQKNSSGTIKSVIVNTSGASQINGTVKVSVSGTPYKCDGENSLTLTATATDYTFTGSASGKILIE